MPSKVILIADPGIDTTFAMTLALLDPNLEVVAILASAGNVSSEQATQNVQLLVNLIDPPRWPRIGAAIPIEYEIDGTSLHGPDGLGGLMLPPVVLHQPISGDRLLVDLVREFPHEITILVLGPGTILARAMDRDPELPNLITRIIMLGGSWHEPGNATAVAEFHFFCDPQAARNILQSRIPITLIPLDVTRKLVFSPTDLLELPAPESSASQLLRKIIPFGIRASSHHYGIEGFHLKDVLGVVAMTIPEALDTQDYFVDVETKGELTRGMSIIDTRPNPAGKPNVHLAIHVDLSMIRGYIQKILSQQDHP